MAKAYACDECRKLLEAGDVVVMKFMEFKVGKNTVAITCSNGDRIGEYCMDCLINLVRAVYEGLKNKKEVCSDGNEDGHGSTSKKSEQTGRKKSTRAA